MFERPAIGERALLVHIKFYDPRLSADLSEFRELALSAGAQIIDIVISSKEVPHPKFLIGTGKLEEISAIVQEHKIDLLLFNHNLSPAQERNIERVVQCRVLDRNGLILDIFAQRARTHEGKLQVELAQLEHLSTRLVRGWSHLERQKGGIGLRGPGETQLEEDKRSLQLKVKNIRQRLERVRSQRELSRRSRNKANIPTVALVGYTNSGKSTLFNVLTNEHVIAVDQLFATLDTTLRSVNVPICGKVILSDTVGFIRDLPHELIDSFKATLEETKDATLLLHVIDIADDLWHEKQAQVEKVLGDIGARHIPVIEVYNKIDLMDDLTSGIEVDFQGRIIRVRVSAKLDIGLTELLHAIGERLSKDIVRGKLTLEQDQAKVRAYLYACGAVESESLTADGLNELNISIQRERWESICAKFNNLVKQIK